MVAVGLGRRRCTGRARCVRVGLDQQFFNRQVDHQKALGMQAAFDEIHLHHALAVGENAFAIHTRYRSPPARFLKRIGADAVGVGHDALVVRPCLAAGNDLGPFSCCGAQATRMVKVMVRTDNVADALAGCQFFHFSNHG